MFELLFFAAVIRMPVFSSPIAALQIVGAILCVISGPRSDLEIPISSIIGLQFEEPQKSIRVLSNVCSRPPASLAVLASGDGFGFCGDAAEQCGSFAGVGFGFHSGEKITQRLDMSNIFLKK